MNPALVYLAVRSIRNGITSRLRRLRQPRYLLVALGVLLYFGMMFLNRSRSGGFINIPPRYELTAQAGAAAVAFLLMAAGWILPRGAALQFTTADVHFLFPAPLARRELLAYKLVRLCVGPAGTSLFLALIFGPTRLLPALAFWAKTSLILSVLALHEAGVSLYRTRTRDAGPLRPGRRWIAVSSILLLAAATAMLLARFAFTSGPRESALLFIGVAAMLVAHVAWILRSDAAFEEEAALLADKVSAAAARIRSQTPQPRTSANRATPFALAPQGRSETAILWKNWIVFRRTSGASFVGPIVILVLLVITFIVMDIAAGDGANPMPFIGFLVAAIAVLFGPITLRLDLRQDLANLALLKTWPVPGAAIVRGEILAPAAILSVFAAIGLAGGALFTSSDLLPFEATLFGRLSFVAGATIASCALIVAQLVIQNGLAIMYPAWIRFTPGGAGVEMMGQSLMVMYGGLFLLLLAALVPGAAGALVAFLTRGLFLSGVVFAGLLLVECVAATEVLGRILDRTDIQDVPSAE